MKITIATINLQSGVATTKGKFHYALTGWKYWLPHSDKPIIEAGQMLKQENIDIACINEITEKSLRSGFRSQTDILAKSAEMVERCFFSSQKFGKFIFYEGNAILSKYKITNTASHLLHREFNMRMALEESVIEMQGQKIVVFIAHLALTDRHRVIQIKEIIDIIKDQTDPIILAGDFNEKNPENLNLLLEKTPLKHRCTIKTFPSWNPKYSFDYIFLSKEFSVIDYYIPKIMAFSDHSALVVKADFNV